MRAEAAKKGSIPYLDKKEIKKNNQVERAKGEEDEG